VWQDRTGGKKRGQSQGNGRKESKILGVGKNSSKVVGRKRSTSLNGYCNGVRDGTNSLRELCKFACNVRGKRRGGKGGRDSWGGQKKKK